MVPINPLCRKRYRRIYVGDREVVKRIPLKQNSASRIHFLQHVPDYLSIWGSLKRGQIHDSEVEPKQNSGAPIGKPYFMAVGRVAAGCRPLANEGPPSIEFLILGSGIPKRGKRQWLVICNSHGVPSATLGLEVTDQSIRQEVPSHPASRVNHHGRAMS